MNNVNPNLNSIQDLSLRSREESTELINTQAALKRLGKLMANHRAQRDLGFREYSALFGDLSPNISAIEKCQLIKMPSLETLSKFADILGVPLHELIKYLYYGDQGDFESQVALARNNVGYIRAAIRSLVNHDDVLDCFEDFSIQLIRTRPPRENK